MYCVEVHVNIIPGERITRFLVFNSYPVAISCRRTLEGTERGPSSPEVFFEAAKISKRPIGEVVSEQSIETDWVLSYVHKTSK